MREREREKRKKDSKSCAGTRIKLVERVIPTLIRKVLRHISLTGVLHVIFVTPIVRPSVARNTKNALRRVFRFVRRVENGIPHVARNPLSRFIK